MGIGFQGFPRENGVVLMRFLGPPMLALVATAVSPYWILMSVFETNSVVGCTLMDWQSGTQKAVGFFQQWTWCDIAILTPWTPLSRLTTRIPSDDARHLWPRRVRPWFWFHVSTLLSHHLVIVCQRQALMTIIANLELQWAGWVIAHCQRFQHPMDHPL